MFRPTTLDCLIQQTACLASCVPPSRSNIGTGIFNLFSIAYAFLPGLRGRLTLGGRTFPRKPWNFGEGDSHPLFRYSCPHNHLYALQAGLRLPFDAAYNAPLLLIQ